MKGAIKIQNITSTYILILTLAATLILAIFGVEKVIRYNCYQNLADAVKQGATNIRSILEMASSSCNQFPLCSQHT